MANNVNKISNGFDKHVNQPPFCFSDEWNNVLLRVQLSFDDKALLQRNACANALNKFINELRRKFCDHTRKKYTTPWGKKFDLDNFHVRWIKKSELTGASLIEVFKQKHTSKKEKEAEMDRKKLQKKILTANQIAIILDGGDKIDVLSKKQIEQFLAYVVALQQIVSEDSAKTLEKLKSILETEKNVHIKRGILMGFLTLTQHQFGGK